MKAVHYLPETLDRDCLFVVDPEDDDRCVCLRCGRERPSRQPAQQDGFSGLTLLVAIVIGIALVWPAFERKTSEVQPAATPTHLQRH
ncbi:hypothetical protein BST81_01585 [Leptolyngbya sp. 'hensonii']|uniref:hypothetical protein n=1 Tax=Leptolyngbya sp. 'hensonii' TaxID=1922337 RepID=UPI0009501F4A|nr:hypothetical protein [Leptolyngbya sp. 'hensonii']OLP20153.1 hypothetical protein BST81_01585 [Leptolyngbya sp. 'hensonii']